MSTTTTPDSPEGLTVPQNTGDGRALAATPSSPQEAVSPVPASIPIAGARHFFIGLLQEHQEATDSGRIDAWAEAAHSIINLLHSSAADALERQGRKTAAAAQAIEARRAETLGSACESAVAESDAPKENDHG